MSDGGVRQRIGAVLGRHAVALISLAVALFATSYNTWRNQTTEAHRNTRAAAFMVLDALGSLQEIADRRYYGGDHGEANRIAGWGKVSAIHDMAPLVSKETSARADALFETWKRDVDRLETRDADAERRIAESIVALRSRVLGELDALR